MRIILAIGVIVSITAISVGSARADSTTSPGKENFHVSTSAVAVPTGTAAVLLSGVITSGKKGRALIVEAFVGSLAPGENGSFLPRVNGVFLEPTDDFGNGNSMGINCPSTATFGCTGGAHWWLDLDAAEAAHPGTFLNQPLNIDLLGVGHTSLGVVANLSARLEKKK
jgi:hypothetical protein